MQKDLHHTGIYVLSKIAGMKSEAAEIVSYSSQFVDDAVYNHALIFENGGAFQQRQTAYKRETPDDISDNLNVNLAFNVLIPFHFLPEIKPCNSDRDLATNPNSNILTKLLEDIKNCGKNKLGLYRLGIGLHTFADVFTHQDFIGFYSEYNNVNLIDGKDQGTFIDLFTDKVPIGHAPVVHNPDIPYINWSYEKDNEKIEINNIEERFLPGMKKIYNFIVEFLNNNPEYKADTSEEDFEDFEDKLYNLLSFEGDVEERHNNWLDNIKNNNFNFNNFNDIDKNLNYDDRAWFNNAVEVISPDGVIESVSNFMSTYIRKYDRYKRKEGFENSNWVKFMLAADEHVYKVNHMIMSGLE